MIALWSMPKPEFNGRWVKFKGVNAMPRPVQKPHPEVVFGGHTKEAFSRAARLAKGWYGFALDLDATPKCVQRPPCGVQGSGPEFEDFEISVTPNPHPRGAQGSINCARERDDRPRYREALRRLGVHRLILLQRGADEASLPMAFAQPTAT